MSRTAGEASRDKHNAAIPKRSTKDGFIDIDACEL
jgi:hypothetical protein